MSGENNDMKDLIVERLSKMEDLEQRKLLKDIVSGFFSNLIDYQQTANKNLEARVFNEIKDMEKNYDVYVTVCNKNDIDPVDEFLYPVFPEDVIDKRINMKEIVEALQKNKEIQLFTLFMKCDYKLIKELIKSNRKYTGVIVTNRRAYSVKVKLVQNTKYIKQIQSLYDIFQKNSIPWKTLNSPYSNKFFDVVMAECEGWMDENEEINEINIDLEEYEKHKAIDIVPLWNVKRLLLKGEGFPMPAIDKINFEHVISLEKVGIGNGYLADAEESLIKYIMRTDKSLIIVSPEEKATAWSILKIAQPVSDIYKKSGFELVSNSRKKNFINKFAHMQASIIRTKGEIKRIVNSLEASKYFEMEDIEIRNSASARATTYDVNSFIVDDIRVGNDKKVMNLKFRTHLNDSFIVYDMLSFLVSEVQMYFPEYECEGELV